MYPWTRHLNFLLLCLQKAQSFNLTFCMLPVHQKSEYSQTHKGPELQFSSEVNQEEGGFQSLLPPRTTSSYPPPHLSPMPNAHREGEEGKWVLPRASHLLLFNPESQVYSIPAQSGKTKYFALALDGNSNQYPYVQGRLLSQLSHL